MTSAGLARILAPAALAAAALAAGCAAPQDALPPPVAALEAGQPADPIAEGPAAPSVAALGLRGSTIVPAGGSSVAEAGRASPSVGLSASHAAAESRTSQAPKDQAQLLTLLATVEAAAPQDAVVEAAPVAIAADAPMVELVAADPAPAPVAPVEEPAIMTLAAAEAAEPAMEPSAIEPAPAIVAEIEPVETVPDTDVAPMQVAAMETEVAADLSDDAVPADDATQESTSWSIAEVIPATAAEPARGTGAQLEDFYRCDYAPVQRRGGVQVMECR